MYLVETPAKSLAVLDRCYFVKIEEPESDGRTARPYDHRLMMILHELVIMILAGDCSVQPVGRVFDGARVCGIITPLEMPVVRRIAFYHMLFNWMTLPPVPQIAQGSMQLITRLHAKGIVHGDIKPENLLFCRRDGKFRLCGFSAAMVLEQGHPPVRCTPAYASAYRLHSMNSPLTTLDDLYATGISVWQLYARQMPFASVPRVPDPKVNPHKAVVCAGFQPDILAVENPKIREFVTACLTRGQPVLPKETLTQSEECCVVAEVAFAGCTATPPHTYTRFVQCKNCTIDMRQEECPNLCRVPGRLSDIRSSKCRVCPRQSQL